MKPTTADPLGLRELRLRYAAMDAALETLPPVISQNPDEEMRAFAAQLDERRRDPRVRASMEADAEVRLEQLIAFVCRWHQL